MSTFNADVDIDVSPAVIKIDYGLRAVILRDEKLVAHPSGFYLDDVMPTDPMTGFAVVDYKEAERVGFIKLDLLTNTAYQTFKSRKEIRESANKEPDWDLLKDPKFVSRLPQLSKSFDIIEMVQPTDIDELADVLALMRPNKLHLMEQYLDNPLYVRRMSLYQRPSKGMFFKKSHSYAYAIMIVAIMNKNDVMGGFGY